MIFRNILIGLFLLLKAAQAQEVDFIVSDACFGDLATLENVTVSTDSIVATTWDFDMDGQFDDGTGKLVERYFPSPGYHTVGMRVVFETGAAEATYKQVYIGYFPLPDFGVANTCVGDLAEFENQSSIEEGEILDYIWNFGDGSQPQYVENPSHIFYDPGTFNVKLTAVSDLGCRDSISRQITVSEPPNISLQFIGDTSFYEGDSLIVKVNGVFDSVVWSNGYHGATIVIFTSGTYTVNAYQGSCAASRTIPVTVKKRPEFGVMNVITPNGDGYNDRWQVAVLYLYEPCEVKVMNRLGQQVYYSSDYQNDWEGTYQGLPLQEGTYYYVMKCREGQVFKGPINIIR